MFYWRKVTFKYVYANILGFPIITFEKPYKK